MRRVEFLQRLVRIPHDLLSARKFGVNFLEPTFVRVGCALPAER